jgi:hypothetical protein
VSRRLGHLIGLLACGLIAVGLQGCVGISGVSTNQAQSMGPVDLTISACAHGAPECGATSNRGNIYEIFKMGGSLDAQLLVGVRLPEGSTPPASLTASLEGGGSLSLSRSTTYEAELQALEPAPTGERWWGWLSTQGTYSASSPQSFAVTIDVNVPRPADGGPFESPMHWRPVVGARTVDPKDGLPADRPVRCGANRENLYNGYAESNNGDTIVCIDSPNAEATTGFLGAPITDFGIVGTSVQASPGGTVTAAFLAKRSGAPDPPTTFTLSAQSGIPGGAVGIDRSSISLGGDSTQPVLATIDVPVGTPPGTYPVTLKATAPGKPERSGTVNVTVPGGGRPSIRRATLTNKLFRLSGKRARSGKGNVPVGTKLRVELSQAADLSIQVFRLTRQGPKSLGTTRRSLPRGQSTLGIGRKIGAIRLSAGRFRIALTAVNAAGERSAGKQLTFTIVAG